jgi:hypothetical protein
MVVMDKAEARDIARRRAVVLRSEPYAVLVANYLNQSTREEMVGIAGVRYDVEVQALWDNLRKPGNLRVFVNVDAGEGRGPRTLITEDFIVAPDGTFVGE